MKNKSLVLLFILIALALIYQDCRKNEKQPEPSLTDIDGNIYNTVKIGNQVWMAGNLKTTRLNDGTDIPLVADATSWSNLTSSGYCWYNNDEDSFKDPYGALYNGYTILTGKLCPEGWHVPGNQEWLILRDLLGDSLNSGGKLKESGSDYWLSTDKGANNSSGFTAVGAGLRYFEGTFASIRSFTSMWSATEGEIEDEWYVGLFYADDAFIMDHRNKKHGFSARCVKD